MTGHAKVIYTRAKQLDMHNSYWLKSIPSAIHSARSLNLVPRGPLSYSLERERVRERTLGTRLTITHVIGPTISSRDDEMPEMRDA